MKALVVVHTEMSYLDPHEFVRVLRVPKEQVPLYLQEAHIRLERLSCVFDAIALEIESRLSCGDSVYYLGDQSTLSDASSVYPAIRRHLPDMTFVASKNGFSVQYLTLKSHLLSKKADDATVVGVAHDCCVYDAYCLLQGIEQRQDKIREYARNARVANIPSPAVQWLLTTPLSSRIQVELTDKCLE